MIVLNIVLFRIKTIAIRVCSKSQIKFLLEVCVAGSLLFLLLVDVVVLVADEVVQVVVGGADGVGVAVPRRPEPAELAPGVELLGAIYC